MLGILDLMKKKSRLKENILHSAKYSRLEVKILVSEKKILDSRKNISTTFVHYGLP